MTANPALRGLNRRALLARAAMAGAALAIGSGFVAAPDAAWALEVTHLKPETMATLIQMARDIYPHDRLGDNFYAVAMKGYDSEAEAAGIEAGIAALNAAAAGAGHRDYLSIGWESERVAVLRGLERSAFFQKVRDPLRRVQWIYPMSPWRMKVGRVRASKITPMNPSGKVFSFTDDDGKQHTLTPYEVLHIPHMSYDGLNGVSPVRMAAQAVAASLAAVEPGCSTSP